MNAPAITDKPLVFIDTETDGLGPDRRVWEVAMGRFESSPNGSRDYTERHFFIGLDTSRSDPSALRVGGFWERHPDGRRATEGQFHGLRYPLLASGSVPKPHEQCLTLSQAADVIFSWTHDAMLVGVNPGFDTFSFERILRSHQLLPTWDYRLLDMRAMAIGWLLARGVSVDVEASSDELAQLCGVPAPDAADRHTALGDVRWAKNWLEHLVAHSRGDEPGVLG